MDLHQRNESLHLRVVRSELCEDAAKTQRLIAERGPDPGLARGGGIALVEDQVDHFEDGREARETLESDRDFETHARLGERPLRSNDPLGDGRGRNEERACDLLCRQAAQHPKNERDPRVL